MTARTVIAACLLLVLHQTSAIPAPLPAASVDEINAIESHLQSTNIIRGEAPYTLAERMAHYHVPGLSIAVIEDFELRWVRHYGLANAATGKPVDDETRFCVGSMSKGVTSAGVLSLVRDGLIDLDGDVNPQLSQWHLTENEFTAQAAVTPRLLMNHTGGAPFSPPAAYSAEAFPSVLQTLRGEAPARTAPVVIDRVPGTEFMYSNSGFTILQLLAEETGGAPFSEVIATRIFTPLGMSRSTFRNPWPPDEQAHKASGHNRQGGVHADPPVWIGHVSAGGLWTTAADYAAFVIEIQNAVRGRSDRLLTQDLARQMIEPQASDKYGLGFFLHDRSGAKLYFSHIGDGAGFVGGFASHRSEGHAAVVLTNGLSAVNLCSEVLKSVAAVYDWPDFLPPVRDNLAIVDRELDAAAGRYRYGLDGIVKLERSGNALHVVGSGLPDYRLFRAASDTFICRERKGELVFAIPTDGAVTSIHINMADGIGRFTQPPQDAVRMGPDEKTPLEMLQAGDSKTAISMYRQAHGEDPGTPDVSESRLNRLGYQLLRADKAQTALAVFDLNAELYGSANSYDSLGEAQMVLGDFEASKRNYRRSLELNPENGNARSKLAEMGVTSP
jgi:CubicO group peptidase (beta-lactamase class C family)